MAHVLDQRPYGDAYQEPGKTASAVLALGMHLLLAVLLVFGLSWQNRPPEAVTVELWTAPPAPAPAPAPIPKVEPPPAPKVEPRPEPRPEPKAEPRVEKPDIAIEQEKKKLEEERQRKLAEQKKLEQQKLAEQKKLEEQKLAEQKKLEEQKRLADDKRRLEQENRQRLNDELARELKGTPSASAGIPGARITGPANVAGATSGDTDAYKAKIAAQIKGKVILPTTFAGNPEAEFLVTQSRDGHVVQVKLLKKSGIQVLDDAWERAIWNASPLPKPDKPEAFSPELRLRFRPHD